MTTSASEVGLAFLKYFILGGILLGTLAAIIKFVRPELAGHLSGALPVAITFTLIVTFLTTKNRALTAKTSRIAALGGVSWLMYAMIVALLLSFTSWSFWSIVSIAISVFVAATACILVFVTFPKESI